MIHTDSMELLKAVTYVFIGLFIAIWLVVGFLLYRDDYVVKNYYNTVSLFFTYTKYWRYKLFFVMIVVLVIAMTLSAQLVFELRQNTTANKQLDSDAHIASIVFSILPILLVFPFNPKPKGQIKPACCTDCAQKFSCFAHIFGGVVLLFGYPLLQLVLYAIVVDGRQPNPKPANIAVVVGCCVALLLFLIFGFLHLCRRQERLNPSPLDRNMFADVDDLHYFGPGTAADVELGTVGALRAEPILKDAAEVSPKTAQVFRARIWVEYALLLVNIIGTTLLNNKKIGVYDD